MKKITIILCISIMILNLPLSLMGEETGLFSDPKEEPQDTVTNTEALSQQPAITSADEYIKGLADGKAAVTGNKVFFLSGCLLDLIGLLIPYIISYDPEPTMLKSSNPNYILGFNSGYDKAMKNANVKYALYGFLTKYAVGGLIYVFYYVFLITLLFS